MRRQHEVDAALAHRLHQRQHVAARDAEAARNAGGFERGDDQVGVVHDGEFLLGGERYATLLSRRESCYGPRAPAT